MYKKISKLNQARLRRPVGELLPSYFEDLNTEDKRNCLKSVMLSVEQDLLNERDKYRKIELGRIKFDLQEKMRLLRPRKKAPGVENYFIDAARDILTKSMFNLIMDKAVLKLKENEK